MYIDYYITKITISISSVKLKPHWQYYYFFLDFYWQFILIRFLICLIHWISGSGKKGHWVLHRIYDTL